LTESLPAEGLASCYIPGLIDGFGDRLLMFDNTDTEAMEILRFHGDLVDTPGFEQVLQERVHQLSRLSQAAFPVIRAIERFETDGSVVLVSNYVPGKRVSALLAEARLGKGFHPAFVTWVVSQVIQPLAVLQSEHDAAHGALTAERVVLTTDGRVRIVEHVLGSALQHLGRTPERLWREFGVVAPVNAGIPRLDATSDVFQVGVLALSMLLARRVTPADLEHRLGFLLDEWSKAASPRGRVFGDPLRLWLERALQVEDCHYESAAQAYFDLRRLPSAAGAREFAFLHASDVNGVATPLVAPRPTARQDQEAEMAHRFSLDGVPVDHATPITEMRPMPEHGFVEQVDEALPIEANDPGAVWPPTSRAGATRMASMPEVAIRKPSSRFRSRRARLSIAAGLAAVAVAEGLVIATMYIRQQQPGTPDLGAAVAAASVTANATLQAPLPVPAAVLPVSGPNSAAVLPGTATDQGGSVIAAGSPDTERRNADALAAVIAQAARNQRSGGVRLSAPIELKVLQGDRVLGSSADGPIVTTAGTHQLDFINTSLGYRTSRQVTFRAGEITTLAVAVPPGRLSVNAEPWAEVWIDNRPMGETPLANLEIPIGEHEVIFRHPDLGERRQNVTVRADTVARASTVFAR
jgi:hypothetical protein